MGLAEYIAKVNWVDFFILFFFIRISYKGFSRGVGNEIVPFLAVLAALMTALHNYSFFGQFITASIHFPISVANLLSFVVTYVAVIYVCKIASAFFVKNARVDVTSTADRMGGALLGMLRAVFSICFVLIVLVLIPFHYFESSIKDRSLTGVKFLISGPALYDKIIKISPDTERYHKSSMKKKIMKKMWRKKERKTEDKDKKKGFFD